MTTAVKAIMCVLALLSATAGAAKTHEIQVEVDNRSLGKPGNRLPARVMIDFTELLQDSSARVNPQSLQLLTLTTDGSISHTVPVRFDDPDPRPDSFHHVYVSSQAKKGFLVFQHQVTDSPVTRYILRYEAWPPGGGTVPPSPAPQIGDYDILRYPDDGPMSGNFHTKLTICDWDNDGLLDIVAVDTLGKITFYRRLGKDLFDFDTPELLKTSDGTPVQCEGLSAIEAFDWDGDGDLDLVVGDETSGVFLIENTGTRSEAKLSLPTAVCDQSGKPIQSPKEPVSEMSFFTKDYAPAPTVFDYNADGKPDLIFGGYITGQIFYYENVADSAKQKPVLVSRGAIASADGKIIDVTWAAAPAFGDLDGDGLPDMVSGHIAEENSRFHWVAEPSLYFWKNTGTRAQPQWTATDFGFPRHWDDYPPDVTVPRITDWNGDGKLDILMSARSEIFYFENIGSKESPKFEFRRRLTMKNGPLIVCPRFNAIAPVFADLNGDGMPDLISGGSGDIPWSRMGKFANAPTFEPCGYLQADGKKIYHEFIHGDDTTFPFIYDWDRDGLLDLLMGDGDGYVTFFRNIGSKNDFRLATGVKLEMIDGTPLCVGQPINATSSDFESHSGNRSVPAPGDYDGDGKLDLICGNAAGNVFFYHNDGSGKFLPGVKIASHNGRGWTYPVDWDGKLDVILSWGGVRKAIFLNRGTSPDGTLRFEERDLKEKDMVWMPTPRPIAIDWDQDGDIDIVWASSFSLLHFASRDFIEHGYANAKLVIGEVKP